MVMFVDQQNIEISNGNILVVVVVFMFLVMGFLFYDFESVGLQKRINHNSYQKLQTSTVANKALNLAYIALIQGTVLHCYKPLLTDAFLRSQSANWWQSSSLCHGQLPSVYKQQSSIIYAYYITPLPSHCQTINSKPAQYWRITSYAAIVASSSKVAGTAVLLQATVALKASEDINEDCSDGVVPYPIHGGWQSWRRIF